MLGLRPGDVLRTATVAGEIRLRVVGIGVVASDAPYPDTQPGIGFVGRGTLVAIQPDTREWMWTEAVRLADAARADEIAMRARLGFEPGSRVNVQSWTERRADAGERSRTIAIVLTTYSALLLVAAGLVLINLVGGHAATRHREIGLLKAVGFTPRLVTLLFLTEQLLLGLAGAAVGVTAARLLLPTIAGEPAALLGTTPPHVTTIHAVIAVGATCLLIAAATMLPTIRGARFSVVQALVAGRSRQSAGSVSRAIRLGPPLPALLGIKDALGRSSRTVAAALALALTVAALVAGLAFEATVRNEARIDATGLTRIAQADGAGSGVGPGLAPGRPDAVAVPDTTRDRIRPIVHGLNAILVLIAAVNLLAIVVLTVRERTRDLAVLKAIGLTPAQLRRSIHATQALAVAAASALGIPLGILLFLGVYAIVNGNTDRTALPPWWALAATPFALATAVAIITTPPARRAARLDIARALTHE